MILFCAVYVPYCTSDAYTGTRAPSEASEGLAFYGKHVFTALVADLLENTWVSQAEEASAGSCADLSDRHLRCAGCAERILRRRVRDGGQLRPAGGIPARHQPRHQGQVHRGQRQHLPPKHSQVSTLHSIYAISTEYLHLIYAVLSAPPRTCC